MAEGLIQTLKDELERQKEDLERDKAAYEKYAAEFERNRKKEAEELQLEGRQTEEAKALHIKTENALNSIKDKWKDQLTQLISLEKENKKLNQNFEEVNRVIESDISTVRVETGLLEGKLDQTTDKLALMREANHWTRHFHVKNIAAVENQEENRVQSEVQYYSHMCDNEQEEAMIKLKHIEKMYNDERQEMQKEKAKHEVLLEECEKLKKEIDEFNQAMETLV